MKLSSILAATAIFAAAVASANAYSNYIVTTNTFSFSGTYSYDALTTNGSINDVTNWTVSASTTKSGGNLLGKKPTSVTTYSTNENWLTVLSTTSFALKDYLAAINTDLTNNSNLSNFLASASLTSLPAGTKLQMITGVQADGNDFSMYLYLVIPSGRTNLYYDLGDAGMFNYDTQGDYVFSRNININSSNAGISYTGALQGIVPVSLNLYSTPNCMPHAELDLYAIGTGNLNFSATSQYNATATTTISLNPLAGNIYVRDARFHKVTGVFVGSGSGSGSGTLNNN